MARCQAKVPFVCFCFYHPCICPTGVKWGRVFPDTGGEREAPVNSILEIPYCQLEGTWHLLSMASREKIRGDTPDDRETLRKTDGS